MYSHTYPTDIVPMTFKLGPACLITSASILSVNVQNNASLPAIPLRSSSRGITDASFQLFI